MFDGSSLRKVPASPRDSLSALKDIVNQDVQESTMNDDDSEGSVVDKYRDGSQSDSAPGSSLPLIADDGTTSTEIPYGDVYMDEDTALSDLNTLSSDIPPGLVHNVAFDTSESESSASEDEDGGKTQGDMVLDKTRVRHDIARQLEVQHLPRAMSSAY